MKLFKLVIFLVFIAFLAVALLPACKKVPRIPTPTAVESTLGAMKDKYIGEIDGVITDYQAKLDELNKKAEVMPSPAKEEAVKKIDAVKAKLDEAKARLAELKTATDATWEKTKTDTDAIVKDMATLYSEAEAAVK